MEMPFEKWAFRNLSWDVLAKTIKKPPILIHLYSLEVEFLNSVKNLPNEDSVHLEPIG